MRMAVIIFGLMMVQAIALAQTFTLGDLSIPELQQISRGLFYVGGSDLHGKIQDQINRQIAAMQKAASDQQSAQEREMRNRIVKELKDAAPPAKELEP